LINTQPNEGVSIIATIPYKLAKEEK
jgi:hypothetical protein